MVARQIAAGMLAAAVAWGGCAALGEAAVLAPVKGYTEPTDPVMVRFLNDNEAGKKAFDKIGLQAVALAGAGFEGMFTPAPGSEVVAADGKPNFEVYTFDGKKIEPRGGEGGAAAEVKADGSVDVSALFPEVKEAGTYVVVWKDACPLVIETLRNPVPWAVIMDDTKVPPEQRADVIKQAASEKPVVTHLVALQYAVIKTDHGDIEAKFSYDVAPHTIDNFVYLAGEKFYDGSTFHRIISGFMIQGGDSLANSPTRAGTGGPGYNVGAEFSDKPHKRGVLSMARAGIDAAGSQFFIVHQDSPHLNGLYTAFGDVMGEKSLKVVDDIASTPADKSSGTVQGARPKIESVRIYPATAEMYGLGKK